MKNIPSPIGRALSTDGPQITQRPGRAADLPGVDGTFGKILNADAATAATHRPPDASMPAFAVKKGGHADAAVPQKDGMSVDRGGGTGGIGATQVVAFGRGSLPRAVAEPRITMPPQERMVSDNRFGMPTERLRPFDDDRGADAQVIEHSPAGPVTGSPESGIAMSLGEGATALPLPLVGLERPPEFPAPISASPDMAGRTTTPDDAPVPPTGQPIATGKAALTDQRSTPVSAWEKAAALHSPPPPVVAVNEPVRLSQAVPVAAAPPGLAPPPLPVSHPQGIRIESAAVTASAPGSPAARTPAPGPTAAGTGASGPPLTAAQIAHLESVPIPAAMSTAAAIRPGQAGLPPEPGSVVRHAAEMAQAAGVVDRVPVALQATGIGDAGYAPAEGLRQAVKITPELTTRTPEPATMGLAPPDIAAATPQPVRMDTAMPGSAALSPPQPVAAPPPAPQSVSPVRAVAGGVAAPAQEHPVSDMAPDAAPDAKQPTDRRSAPDAPNKATSQAMVQTGIRPIYNPVAGDLFEAGPDTLSPSDRVDFSVGEGNMARTGPFTATQRADIAARPELARAVTQQLTAAAGAEPGRAVELTLAPEELGRMRLSLTTQDNMITVNITAERAETADLLRRHIDILAQEFRQIGYSDIAFEFGRGGRGAASQDRNGGAPDGTMSPHTDTTDTLPVPLTIDADDRLDIRL